VDVDVIHVRGDGPVKLAALAGKGSGLQRRHQMHIDIVMSRPCRSTTTTGAERPFSLDTACAGAILSAAAGSVDGHRSG
jgi:hypothetical protein